eukprot:CAMPEP_0203839780 /NCGR_PEP_ID=MMETSP0359-20131031/378_1 /ASSEMBLY_ACC=CAM_ASM_000338 /TAXON_ID=268821 /ORGANISM="Scrippsiella Hangoei, Strain SHTV-5" /LENGTH=196 /DNA_ID=CAMNT_0050753873 /DNA_START=57 /DNA_END=647 /DNA_ORIENTATION=-
MSRTAHLVGDSVEYVSASQLRCWLESDYPDEEVVIIDCRDEDRAGGHIPGSRHCPSASFRANVGYLIKDVLRDGDEVERAPEEAAEAEAQADAFPGDEDGGKATPEPPPLRIVFHCMYSQSRGPSCARIFHRELSELLAGELEATPELGAAAPRRVNVSVLSNGFLGWQDAMPDLVEGRDTGGREVGPRAFYTFSG